MIVVVERMMRWWMIEAVMDRLVMWTRTILMRKKTLMVGLRRWRTDIVDPFAARSLRYAFDVEVDSVVVVLGSVLLVLVVVDTDGRARREPAVVVMVMTVVVDAEPED